MHFPPKPNRRAALSGRLAGVRASVAGAISRFSRGPNATAVARVSSRYRTVPSDRRRQFVFESGCDSRTPPSTVWVSRRARRPTRPVRPGRRRQEYCAGTGLPRVRVEHRRRQIGRRCYRPAGRATSADPIVIDRGSGCPVVPAGGLRRSPRRAGRRNRGDCGFAATISARHDSADSKDDTVPAFEDCVRGREVRAHDWAVLAVEAESAHDGVGAFISGEGEHREVGSKRTSGRPGGLENMSGARH